jgi:hypothetical protein
VDAGTFYGTLAAGNAAIFGVGGVFFASRLVSLAERLAVIRREQADLRNSLKPAETDWAIRSRDNELADLHQLATEVRASARWPIMNACAVVTVCCLALLERWADQEWVRFVLLADFGGFGLLWWQSIRRTADCLLAATRPAFDSRKAARDAGTAAGQSFLITGNPAQLYDPKLVDRLAADFPELRTTRRQRFALRRWKWKLRQSKEPIT